MILRASIHPSILSPSWDRTRYQRSLLLLSFGSGISTESRRSTTSPRFTSSKSAATTAVELRICALRATPTPVLLRLAIALHPVKKIIDSRDNVTKFREADGRESPGASILGIRQ